MLVPEAILVVWPDARFSAGLSMLMDTSTSTWAYERLEHDIYTVPFQHTRLHFARSSSVSPFSGSISHERHYMVSQVA